MRPVYLVGVNNRYMVVISCHTVHISSPHGLHKGYQNLLRDGIPIVLKKLNKRSQISCREMFVDAPAECIPEVLNERQIIEN